MVFGRSKGLVSEDSADQVARDRLQEAVRDEQVGVGGQIVHPEEVAQTQNELVDHQTHEDPSGFLLEGTGLEGGVLCEMPNQKRRAGDQTSKREKQNADVADTVASRIVFVASTELLETSDKI